MRRAWIVIAASVCLGCRSAEAPSQDAPADPASAEAPRPAPPPTWDEPLLPLAAETAEASLLEGVPALVELVPVRGDDDARELDRFEAGSPTRVPLGAGWEALDLEVSGRGRFFAFENALAEVEQQTRRLVHARRVRCARDGAELTWEFELRAYVQPQLPADAASARASLRRIASLLDAYALRSWELDTLRELTAGLDLRYEALSFAPGGVELRGQGAATALDTLEERLTRAVELAVRYRPRLEREDGAGFRLELARLPAPQLPGEDAAPEALADALGPEASLGDDAALFDEVARIKEQEPTVARLAAAGALLAADKLPYAESLIVPALEENDAAEWTVSCAVLCQRKGSATELERARELLRLAQSLQWPVFLELTRAAEFAPLRDDAEFLLDLALAEREALISKVRDDPFALPEVPASEEGR